MANVEQEVRAAFETATNTISADTAERFRKEMEERGLDPSAALAKHGASPSPGEQQPVTPQRYAPDIDPATGLPRFTPDQTKALAENLKKFWTGDPTVLDAALKNASAAPIVAPAGPDTRTELERDFDASSLAGVRPEEYALDGAYVGRGQINPAMDRTIRTALGELSVAKSLGVTTVEAFLDSGREYAAVAAKGDLAVKQYHLEESAKFARVNRVGWQQAAAEMKPWLEKVSPATREFLAKSGAVESAAGRTRLYQAFTLQRERAGMKGGKP